MFKDYCAKFAASHDLKTILVNEHDSEVYSHETNGKATWYFYKEINGVKIPAHVEFETRFRNTTSKKELFINASFPFPLKEIIELTNDFINEVEPFFKDYFNSLDTDRIRKITNGQTYYGAKINHNKDLKKLIDLFQSLDESFDEENLNELYGKMANYLLQNHRETSKGNEERFLIVHGEKGKQISEKLEENLLAKTRCIYPDVYAIEPLFPFAKGAKSRHLSGNMLEYGVPHYIRDSGVIAFVMTEDELRHYVPNTK